MRFKILVIVSLLLVTMSCNNPTESKKELVRDTIDSLCQISSVRISKTESGTGSSRIYYIAAQVDFIYNGTVNYDSVKVVVSLDQLGNYKGMANGKALNDIGESNFSGSLKTGRAITATIFSYTWSAGVSACMSLCLDDSLTYEIEAITGYR